MSITAIVHLNGGLDNQQTQSSSTSGTDSTPRHPSTSASISTSALPQDAFIPSSQTESVATSAQAAGLFNAPKTSALPWGSTSLGAQGATNNTAEIAAPSNSSGGSRAGSDNSSTSGGSDTTAQTASTSQDTSTSSPSAASDSTSSASTSGGVAKQTQLDSLNNALAALGLSAADIQQIDQVASLTNDYSPTAFTSLAYQLEAQAQNAATPSASAQTKQTPASGAAATGASSTSTAATPATPQGSASSSQSGSDGQNLSLHSTQQSAQTQNATSSAGNQPEPKSSAASA
jgi:hypothetical protein